ncbi:hypothetical protein SARC_00842 [Sphaeroforma arctica JP610]|uniref:Deoxyribodipyrimidine photo-lyase n=1 Tax=Sphaeroforma arctica JP610 TaxID=667725 RepID=A0A0L0GDE1_9EUKA|nr:hypothetical protein SARC_00842 [Sphaeroforma arctica JP610]KNC87032.1 hypothetical protein SARC_00842 [Sphaeroforma arctica JP610]|eukprot:XP_014160934.1 hypothetical protein SARC_00842 [Sphaeroforma arctica JP610]
MRFNFIISRFPARFNTYRSQSVKQSKCPWQFCSAHKQKVSNLDFYARALGINSLPQFQSNVCSSQLFYSTMGKRARSGRDSVEDVREVKKLKSVKRTVEEKVNSARVRRLNGKQNIGKIVEVEEGHKTVIYWMERDVRVNDNWALLYAEELAQKNKLTLSVVYVYPERYREEATVRQELFRLRGLQEVSKRLQGLNIPFHFLVGDVAKNIVDQIDKLDAAVVVVDFHALRQKRKWRDSVAEKVCSIPVMEVDAHNVVPVWGTSEKCEYGARTIRTKIHKRLAEFGTEFPEVEVQEGDVEDAEEVDWDEIMNNVDADHDVPEVKWCTPGEAGAMEALETFVNERLQLFARDRNDPNVHASSDLSCFFNFGQLSAQRAFLVVQTFSGSVQKGRESFIEESIVRRELSDNFCFYKPDTYDTLEGAPGWAQESLEKHTEDKREYTYTSDEFAKGNTHDDLWNAAQLQMVEEGKMHGFLRMYWAKKILEWTQTPQTALKTALYLNDKYEIDGYDPNGYVGCIWSIGGVHDQGWMERSVFGKVRYMNYNGCLRKFNVYEFVQQYPQAVKNCKAQGGTPTKEKHSKKKK